MLTFGSLLHCNLGVGFTWQFCRCNIGLAVLTVSSHYSTFYGMETGAYVTVEERSLA